MEKTKKPEPPESQKVAAAVQRLMKKSDGQTLLKHLSKMCHENEATYVDQNSDGTAFKEGQRSVIINLRLLLNKDLSKAKQEKAKL
jgi:hypothetical protein